MLQNQYCSRLNRYQGWYPSPYVIDSSAIADKSSSKKLTGAKNSRNLSVPLSQGRDKSGRFFTKSVKRDSSAEALPMNSPNEAETSIAASRRKSKSNFLHKDCFLTELKLSIRKSSRTAVKGWRIECLGATYPKTIRL
jgi:hypothetical protein